MYKCPERDARMSKLHLFFVLALSNGLILYTLSRRRPRHRPAFEVCVLTAERPQNASYIAGHLRALQWEGLSPADMTVVDVDGSADLPKPVKVPAVRRADPNCLDDGKDVVAGVPCRVHQNNLDVATALRLCYREAVAAKKHWILFLEDDMVACEGSIQSVEKALREARHVAAVKFSKFSRAFAVQLHSAHDLAREIERQADVAPYDMVLWGNRWNGKTNIFQIYPSNLFHHVGAVSTVLYRNEPGYRKVYGQMRSDVCGEPLF